MIKIEAASKKEIEVAHLEERLSIAQNAKHDGHTLFNNENIDLYIRRQQKKIIDVGPEAIGFTLHSFRQSIG